MKIKADKIGELEKFGFESMSESQKEFIKSAAEEWEDD